MPSVKLSRARKLSLACMRWRMVYSISEIVFSLNARFVQVQSLGNQQRLEHRPIYSTHLARKVTNVIAARVEISVWQGIWFVLCISFTDVLGPTMANLAGRSRVRGSPLTCHARPVLTVCTAFYGHWRRIDTYIVNLRQKLLDWSSTVIHAEFLQPETLVGSSPPLRGVGVRVACARDRFPPQLESPCPRQVSTTWEQHYCDHTAQIINTLLVSSSLGLFTRGESISIVLSYVVLFPSNSRRNRARTGSKDYMTRSFPSTRGAKPYRARLCLARPRVRAQVSVQALEPGLARAEPEVDAQVSAVPQTPAAPASPPPPATADSGAQAADDDGAVLAAPAASADATVSVNQGASDQDAAPADSGATGPAAETADAGSADGGERGSSKRVPPKKDVEYISPEDFPYQVGDVVTGRVVYANARGARVAIHGCTNVLGYAFSAL